MLGADRTMVSNIEAARTGISANRVRQLACHYQCPNPDLVESLAAMASSRKVRRWWEEYRGKLPDGFLDMSEVEYHATHIRTAQTVHLPGLLQTEDHARAIFDLAVPTLPRLEVELRVAHRLGRQSLLTCENPTRYVGVIHEAALRMRFGTADVARAQLQHLVDMAERDNITLLVIPFSVGNFHGAGQTVLYAQGDVPELDTVHLDTSFGAQFLDAPTPLANYRSLLDLMEGSALPADPSRQFIHSIAQDM